MSDLPLAAGYARSTRLGWQLFLGTFAAAGLALVLAGFLAEGRGTSGLPFFVPGIALALVFGALFLTARGRFADPAPVITLTAEAFHDRRLGDPIPWTAIRGLKRLQPGNRVFLLIEVEEPARWLTNAGLLARPMQAVNPAMGFPAVGSRLDGLDIPQEQLAAAAEAAWKAVSPGGP